MKAERQEKSWTPFVLLSFILLLGIPKISAAQTESESAEIRQILTTLYEEDGMVLFKCSIRKAKISKAHAHTTLRRYANSDLFPKKKDEIYAELRLKKDQAHWLAFYSQFFVQNIAEKYARLCDMDFANSTRNTLGGDVRFPPFYRTDDWIDPSSIKLNFGRLHEQSGEYLQYVQVQIKGEMPFLMRYTLRKEKNAFRIFDVSECYEEPDRSDRPGISLQDELRMWKEGKSENLKQKQ